MCYKIRLIDCTQKFRALKVKNRFVKLSPFVSGFDNHPRRPRADRQAVDPDGPEERQRLLDYGRVPPHWRRVARLRQGGNLINIRIYVLRCYSSCFHQFCLFVFHLQTSISFPFYKKR